MSGWWGVGAGRHARVLRGVFAGEAVQAIVARIDPLPAKESEYTDHVPVRGKATF
ncbi:hypothetical protein GA0115259_106242 [Streptomyces sp. MnatMP-M17]|nr:hypothetical protein GA0115259_106242 [Streptomyces sp. MnatMP-M17]